MEIENSEKHALRNRLAEILEKPRHKGQLPEARKLMAAYNRSFKQPSLPFPKQEGIIGNDPGCDNCRA